MRVRSQCGLTQRDYLLHYSLEIVGDLDNFPAKVVNEDLLETLERVAKVEQGSRRLVDAGVEDLGLDHFLEVASLDKKLAVLDLDRQNLLEGHDLGLEVLLHILRLLVLEQACIYLVDVLIQAVVSINNDQPVLRVLPI